MAHLFKRPKDGQKGILVFTHKEAKYFFQTIKPLIRKQPTTAFPYLVDLAFTKYSKLPFFIKEFNELRQNYYLGLHFGWYHSSFPVLDFFDFIMAGPGTVGFTPPDHILQIPLNSRNFISSRFKNLNYNHKFWDIICVARSIKYKNLNLLLKSIKELNKKTKKCHKALLVIPPNKNKDPKKFYTNIIEDYYNWFEEEERDWITILKLDDDLSFLGMPQNSLIHFYNASKIFTLFSEQEGESRVIAEALLCGLPVVVKTDLEGGGRDFLHDQNAVFFDTFETAHLAFEQALSNLETLKASTSSLAEHLREDYTIPTLKKYFVELYKKHGQQFDGDLLNLDYLDRRLPGHSHNVPWNTGRYGTADILSIKQFNIFKKHLGDHV